MKLNEYIKMLNEYIKENPEHSDLDVIYFSDPEGNGVHYVDIDECSLEYIICTKHFVEITDASDHMGIEVISIN